MNNHPQIGPNWALTAAHCVNVTDTEAPLPAESLTLMLGVHDRTKLPEDTRFEDQTYPSKPVPGESL